MLRTSRTINVAGVNGVSVTDDFLLVDSTVGAITLALPSINALSDFVQRGSGYNADVYSFKISDIGNNAATNNITIQASGSDTVNGLPSAVISVNGGSAIVTVSGNSSWVASSSISNEPVQFLPTISGTLTQNYIIGNNQVVIVQGTINFNGFTITTDGNGQIVFIA